jgi:hypothetical protein
MVAISAVGTARRMPALERPSTRNAECVGRCARAKRRWLFSTPAPDVWETIDHKVVAHGPVYVLKLWYLAFCHWPAWLARATLRRLRSGRWIKVPSDGDVLDAVTGGSLIMLTSNNATSDVPGSLTRLTFRAPANLSLHLLDGQNVAGLTIVFDVPERRILHASLPGHWLRDETLTPDSSEANGKILACLALITQMYTHPKLHVASERSAFEIAHAECTALEPSSRFVFSLHEGLLFSTQSPLYPGVMNSGTRTADMMHQLPIPIPHKLDGNLRVFPAYEFMWQAHVIVASW